MATTRPFIPREYQASDLWNELEVSSVPTREKSMHMLFATLVQDIDRRASISQDLKDEILVGLAQAWLWYLETQSGAEVHVEQRRDGVSIDVDDIDDSRPASSQPYSPSDGTQFDESLRDEHEADVSLAQFERDMRRLDDLRRQYVSPGLNSAEGAETDQLCDDYGLTHREWWQQKYLNEENGGS